MLNLTEFNWIQMVAYTSVFSRTSVHYVHLVGSTSKATCSGGQSPVLASDVLCQ